MAIDLMLFEDLISNSKFSMAFRFYRWQGAWLSVGKNQSHLPLRWVNLVNKGALRIVRRPSGGKAVLHSGGLTYALVLPSPPRGKLQAYYHACNWLVKGFLIL